MMHVVIPVRVGANRSLLVALASIARHTDLIPVIIGHNPGVAVAHISTVQGIDPFANQELAMRAALEADWISDPFIWSNDDIYWTRQADPIRWALGQLPADASRRPSVYRSRKVATRTLLTEHGLPTFDYESHTPLPVMKQAMHEALTLGGTMRSTYGNLTGPPDRIAADVKVRQHHDPIPDAEWISTARPSLIPAFLT